SGSDADIGRAAADDDGVRAARTQGEVEIGAMERAPAMLWDEIVASARRELAHDARLARAAGEEAHLRTWFHPLKRSKTIVGIAQQAPAGGAIRPVVCVSIGHHYARAARRGNETPRIGDYRNKSPLVAPNMTFEEIEHQ